MKIVTTHRRGGHDDEPAEARGDSCPRSVAGEAGLGTLPRPSAPLIAPIATSTVTHSIAKSRRWGVAVIGSVDSTSGNRPALNKWKITEATSEPAHPPTSALARPRQHRMPFARATLPTAPTASGERSQRPRQPWCVSRGAVAHPAGAVYSRICLPSECRSIGPGTDQP